ncbi:MAG: hypothetical protein M3014_11395 [Chloroflexota bacterium]|nr:hypothetical protein [Chloroflexota bacterium]
MANVSSARPPVSLLWGMIWRTTAWRSLTGTAVAALPAFFLSLFASSLVVDAEIILIASLAGAVVGSALGIYVGPVLAAAACRSLVPAHTRTLGSPGGSASALYLLCFWPSRSFGPCSVATMGTGRRPLSRFTLWLSSRLCWPALPAGQAAKYQPGYKKRGGHE